jgi:hypothetical protein
MKNQKERRHPLDVEHFGEGNRQKFTLILIACMFIIMFVEVHFHVLSAPYLSFLTYVGSFFIGGATVSAWVAANKSQTVNQNINEKQTIDSNVDIAPDTQVVINRDWKSDPSVRDTI